MKLFFITANSQWGGSEELWSRSLLLFKQQGHDVLFSAPYDSNELTALSSRRVKFFRFIPPLLIRAFIRLGIKREITPVETLSTQLQAERPDLVIISQGNNIESEDIMAACMRAKVPYVTISQLVAELHFLAIKNDNYEALKNGYLNARTNFFISQHNLKLNNVMIGADLPNAVVVFNPCKVKGLAIAPYPADRQTFSIAMVGRIECYHKGYDLMIQVMRQQKWKDRPIQINLYGKGPHQSVLQANMNLWGIKNVFFKAHVSNIPDIWAENHILLMSSRIEGQALSLIEAMWCERAAIVTDVGGAAELITEGVNGFIAPTASVDALDDAMERAWAKRDDWKTMGAAAKNTIQTTHPVDEVAYFNEYVLDKVMKKI